MGLLQKYFGNEKEITRPRMRRVYHTEWNGKKSKQIQSETPLDDEGREHGVARRFFHDGSLEFCGAYDHGVKIGLHDTYVRNNFFKKDGGLHQDTTWAKRELYMQGVLRAVEEFITFTDLERQAGEKDLNFGAFKRTVKVAQRGQLHGSTFYGEDGQLAQKNIYYPNGDLAQLERFDNGIRAYKEAFYPGNRPCFAIGCDENGAIHGDLIVFWPSGRVREVVCYVHGKRKGYGISHHDAENSPIALMMRYEDGKKRVEREYDLHHNLIRETPFDETEQKHGAELTWKDGVLQRPQYHVHGEAVPSVNDWNDYLQRDAALGGKKHNAPHPG